MKIKVISTTDEKLIGRVLELNDGDTLFNYLDVTFKISYRDSSNGIIKLSSPNYILLGEILEG